MPDWKRFADAYAAGLPNGKRLALALQMESWLDLSPDDSVAALDKALDTLSPRLLFQNLQMINLAILRDAGITPGPDTMAGIQRLMDSVQQGTASDSQRVAAHRLSATWQLGDVLMAKDPTVMQPLTDELRKVELQQQANQLFARLEPLNGRSVPGMVSPEVAAEVEAILADAQSLLAGAAPANPALPHVLSMTGGTARTLASCYVLLGRNADALTTFAQAAKYFADAGEQTAADDCQKSATDLQLKLEGRLDAAAAAPLLRLGQVTADPDPFAHIEALMTLAEVATEAGDTFEASDKAEAAAAELKELQYADPAAVPLTAESADQAMTSWIAAATAGATGLPMLARLTKVAQWYDRILSARYAVLVPKDAAKAEALSNLKEQLEKLNSQVHRHAVDAEADLMRKLRRYSPEPPPTAPVNGQPVPDSHNFDAVMEQCHAIDKALAAITDTCNQRMSTGESMDDLLASLHQLQAQADQLKIPEYESKTRLEEAYVLQQLNRQADVIPVAQEARKRLLAGRAPSLSSLPQAYQRYWYLQSLTYEMLAHMVLGDLQVGLDIAEATIQDYESERYRVASDYRQSATLSAVADFYKWAALTAFKLQKWDNMLQAIDLIKARSAIRSRLVPDPPESLEPQLTKEFADLSNTLAAGGSNPALEEKRREIWDLLSIARAGSGTVAQLPELTVPSLQAALAEDEALVGYFWLNEAVLLTVLVDSSRFHAERILLTPEQVQSLSAFVAFIQKLKSSYNLNLPVAKLGTFLLPPFVRDFMQTKRRIIFSPHHSLHLFPFHAARWNDGFVGTEFAVRYVPNFSSILLPWDKRPDNRVLAIGIQTFTDKTVTPLTNVEGDVAAIRQFYELAGTPVATLLGKEATRERVETLRQNGELSKFRCVHLGTHGLSVFENPNQPLESRLLLQDAALDAMDIANLRLNADLAVMSACHSGQRAIQVRNLGDIPGDDIFGLQSALFKSGVRSILATLWLVETDSASAITREFHRHFAAGAPAEVALQLAVKQYLATAPSHTGVYWWAPYFISSLGSAPKGETKAWQN